MSDKGQEARGKLLPCPFCGGEAVLEHGTEYAPWFEVDCPNCDAEGPTRPTEAEAIEAWNRRTETASDTLMRVFAYDATCGVCDKRKERTAKVIDKSVGRHSISDFDWIGKCEKCGNEIQYSFDFCPYCGAELEWSE